MKSGGMLTGIKIVPRISPSTDSKQVCPMVAGMSYDINHMHKLLGHVSESTMKKTASYYGWKVSGLFQPCEDCNLAKPKGKPLEKESGPRSITPGGCFFIDISSIKNTSYGGKKFWLLVVDECTNMSWSFFMNAKSELVEVMLKFLKDIQGKHGSHTGRIIRCDNAGENFKLKEKCEEKGLKINFEFTAPGTPQQNGKVERKFATLYSKVRAIINIARVPVEMRNGLWAECA